MNPPPVPPENTPVSPPSAAGPPPVPPADSPPGAWSPALPPAPPQSRPPAAASPSVGDSAPGGLKAVWIGCGVLLLVAAAALVMAVNWTYDKAREILNNPDKITETVLKASLSAHPDVEFVDLDRGTRSARIRDRKSGEIMTFSYDDMRDGRITVKKSDGTSAEIGADGIRVTDAQGQETRLGPGEAVPLPDWVPAYPGPARVMTSSAAAAGANGFRLLATGETVAEARKHWERALSDAGFNTLTATESAAAGFRTAELKAVKPDGKTVEVVLSSSAEKQTMMRVSFREK